jgi:O-antigen/teichoic acid export membrane protein
LAFSFKRFFHPEDPLQARERSEVAIAVQSDGSGRRESSLLKDSSYSLLTIGGSKAILFAAGVILARLLGAADLGVFTLLITIGTLASSVSLFGIPHATTQRLASSIKETRVAITSGIIVLTLSTLCSLLLALAASWIATDLYGAPSLAAYLPIVATFVLLNNMHQFLLAVLQGLNAIRLYNLLVFFASGLYLAFMTMGAAAYGLPGAVWANSAYLLVALMFTFVPVIRRVVWKGRGRADFVWSEQKGILKFAGYLTAGGALAHVAQWYGPTALVQSHTFESLGFFRVANTLSANLMVIPMAVAVPLFPSLASLHATDGTRFLHTATNSFRLVTMTTLPIALLMCLFPVEILTLFFGHSYASAGDLLFLMSGAGFLMALNSNAGSLYYGTGEMFASMVLNGVWGAAFCVLAILLIPSLSGIGMGLAYLGSYGLLTIIQFRLQRIKWGIHFPRLTIIIAAVVASFGTSYLIKTYTEGLVHYLLGGALLFLVVVTEFFFLHPGEKERIGNLVGFVRDRR